MTKRSSTLFTLAFALFALVQGAWADGAVVGYKYFTWNANEKTLVEHQGTIPEGATVHNISQYADGATMSGWVLVDGTYDLPSSLKNVSGTLYCEGDVRMILADGAKLSASIEIKSGATLYVYAQSNGDQKGKLIAHGAGSAAGIFVQQSGVLEVHGGDIDAKGGEADFMGEGSGAGIGGSHNESAGTITIYGGSVTAKGGKDAAGIGSGEQTRGNVNGGVLNVYGGIVKAEGGEHGAGIGGGQDASGATVTIYGGTVTATGGTDAAGIGSGERYTASSINGGSLTINGGTVFADGTGWGAGIGGGEDANGANVVINGGTVVAWAGADAGKKNGSAIGSEDGDGHYGSLKISEGLIVKAGQNPSSASLFPYSTRVPACRWRPYARIEPCVHSYTYTINKNSNPSTHTMTCKYCGHSETHEHIYESNGICGVCGYDGGEGFWTVTISTPDVDGEGNPQSAQGGGVVYSGVGYNVGKGKSFLLPSCDVKVNGYKFKGWVKNSASTGLEAANGVEFLDPDNDNQNAVTVNANVTYKAHYGTVKVVTVSEAGSSEPNGGYVTYRDTVLTGSNYTLPPAHGVDGYEFVGWYVGSIEDLVEGGYAPASGVQYDASTQKFSTNGKELKNADEVITVSADVGIVAIYVQTKFGAVTVAANRSSATIDGAYTDTDVTNIPKDITVDTVIFNRDFVKDVPSTIVLPFSTNIEKVEGANFYDITNLVIEDGAWHVKTHRIGKENASETIVANKPYLLKPTANGQIVFHPDPDEHGIRLLKTSEKSYTVDGEPLIPGDRWSFRGAFNYFVFGDSTDILGRAYGFSAETDGNIPVGKFVRGGAKANIPALRAYLVHEKAPSPIKANFLSNTQLVSAPQVNYSLEIPNETVVVEFDDEERTTVIGTLNPVTGQIRMKSADRWFDVQGRLLKGKPTAKGRYFHNGRVEIIK